jgi:hypothetical protein
MAECSIDGGSLVGIIILGLFIASMGGLFSKDKNLRIGALKVGFGIAIGGTLFVWLFNC